MSRATDRPLDVADRRQLLEWLCSGHHLGKAQAEKVFSEVLDGKFDDIELGDADEPRAKRAADPAKGKKQAQVWPPYCYAAGQQPQQWQWERRLRKKSLSRG